MDNHTDAEQILDHSAPTDPLPLDSLPLILNSIFDLEEDDIFDVQSFDEDDMYDWDSSSDPVGSQSIISIIYNMYAYYKFSASLF